MLFRSAWAWEHGETRKPDFERETHCHQEGVETPPGDEYSPQSTPARGTQQKRGRKAVKTTTSVKTDSNPDTVSNPNLDNTTDTRAPDPASISLNLEDNKSSKTHKKKRSAQSLSESFTQLAIWDITGETNLE